MPSPRQPRRLAPCRAPLPPEAVAVSGAEPRRPSGESWPNACSRLSAMTGEPGRGGLRQLFRARLPERQRRGQADERHSRMPCRQLSAAYTTTAVPRPISCCKATTRTNKWQGRNTRRNQEEPLGLTTFGDGRSAPQVTQGALPKQDSGLVAHHGVVHMLLSHIPRMAGFRVGSAAPARPRPIVPGLSPSANSSHLNTTGHQFSSMVATTVALSGRRRSVPPRLLTDGCTWPCWPSSQTWGARERRRRAVNCPSRGRASAWRSAWRPCCRPTRRGSARRPRAPPKRCLFTSPAAARR